MNNGGDDDPLSGYAPDWRGGDAGDPLAGYSPTWKRKPRVPGIAAETTAAKSKSGPAPERPTETSAPLAAAAGYIGSIPFSDRIAALTSAGMTGSSYGGGFGKNYDTALEQIRHVMATAKQEHGVASGLGTAAGYVQQAMVSPTAAVSAGKSVLPALLKQGAAFGAAQGASNTSDLTNPAALATNTGLGAAAGIAGGLLGAGLGKAGAAGAERAARSGPIRALLARAGVGLEDNATAAAKAKLVQSFERDRMSGGDLLSRADDAVSTGKPVVLADLGEGNVRGLTQGVATVPGKGQQRLREGLEGRIGDKTVLEQGPQTQRVRGDLQHAFNAQPEDLHAVEQSLTGARDAASNVNYGKARASTADVAGLPEVQALLNDPQYGSVFRDAHTMGVKLARAKGETVPQKLIVSPSGGPLGYSATMGDQPTVATLDFMKRGLDATIERKMKQEGLSGVEAGILRDKMHTMLGALDTAVPEYGAARAAHAEASKGIDALVAGRDQFGAAAPEVTAQQVARMTPAQRALYQRGAYGNLDAKIANRGDNLDPVSAIAGKEMQRQQLSAALQDRPDAATNLLRGLEWERRIRGTRDAAFGGSNTANKQAAIADLGVGPQDVARTGADIARGRLPSALYDLFVRHGAQRLGAAWSEPTNDAIAKLLLARPDAAMLADLARTGARTAASRRAMPNLARIFGAESGSLASQP